MADTLWRLDIKVSAKSAEHFQLALELFFDAVTAYLDDDEIPVRLEAYSEQRPDMALVEARLIEIAKEWEGSSPDFEVSEVQNRDWLTEYAIEHPPLSIGRYFIYGSHFEGVIPCGKIPLLVDAATAFGTGEHATTEGCLRAIELLSKRYNFTNTLDMGCGSAILGMAAVKTWGGSVLATDIDIPSVEMARHNVLKNKVSAQTDVILSTGYQNPVIARNAPYDLILANILARPLSEMAKDLSKHLFPGGFAILSGFHHVDANWVFAAHRSCGLKLVKRIKINEWQTLILQKR